MHFQHATGPILPATLCVAAKAFVWQLIDPVFPLLGRVQVPSPLLAGRSPTHGGRTENTNLKRAGLSQKLLRYV